MHPECLFTVDEAVKSLGLKGIYFTVNNMKNRALDHRFDSYKNEHLQTIREKLSVFSLENNQILAGFRELHTAVNRSNKKFISSPENLVQIFLKYNDLPHINLIVDIYNFISLKYFLALGSHDLSKVDGAINLKITTGSESFLPLGYTEKRFINAGDYAYVDDNNDVLCHMEVKQCEKTKVTLDTTDSFYIVQGNIYTSDEYLNTATNELIALTKEFCGGHAKIVCEF